MVCMRSIVELSIDSVSEVSFLLEYIAEFVHEVDHVSAITKEVLIDSSTEVQKVGEGCE